MNAQRTHSVPVSFFLPTWFSADGVPIALANDLRAALPAWLIGMLLVSAGFLPFGDSAGVLGYTVGCSALGAIMAGHDFTHRTLLLAFTQPIARLEIWRRRMIIAACGALPIAFLALLQPRTFGFLSPSAEAGWGRFLIFAAPLLNGLCIVPWVTLLCRSPLAGAVLCVWIPFGIMEASDWAASWRFGRDAWQEPAFQYFRANAGCLLLLTVSTVGALAGLRKFLNLEAIEPRGTFSGSLEIAPASADEYRRRRTTPGPVWWRLVQKEVRLQWLALVPAGGLAATLLAWQFQEQQSQTYPLMAAFWGFFACVLIGATGSAEERQMGVLPVQSLMPLAHWKQWGFKIAVLSALAGILVVFVPSVVMHFGPWNHSIDTLVRAGLWCLPAVASLLLASLYVSSFAPTSLQAILLSLPVCGLLMIAMPATALWTYGPIALGTHENPLASMDAIPFLVMVPGILTLALAACRNHFTLEHRFGTIARQVFIASAVALFAGLAITLVPPDFLEMPPEFMQR